MIKPKCYTNCEVTIKLCLLLKITSKITCHLKRLIIEDYIKNCVFVTSYVGIYSTDLILTKEY